MQAEPSKDARADQPTETICMFTLRGKNQSGAAHDIRDEAEMHSAIDWTQTTRPIQTETVVTAEMPWCDGCRAYRTIGHNCNDLSQDERRQLNEHGFAVVPVKGTHGLALTPRGRDFVELAGCAWYLAGAFVFGLGLASLLGWLGWTY